MMKVEFYIQDGDPEKPVFVCDMPTPPRVGDWFEPKDDPASYRVVEVTYETETDATDFDDDRVEKLTGAYVIVMPNYFGKEKE